MDASVYEAWRDQYLDVHGVIPLTWHALNEEKYSGSGERDPPANF